MSTDADTEARGSATREHGNAVARNTTFHATAPLKPSGHQAVSPSARKPVSPQYQSTTVTSELGTHASRWL